MAIEDEMKDVQQLVVNQLGVANGLNNSLADGQVTPAKMSTGAPTWETNGALFTKGDRIEINPYLVGDDDAYIDFHSSSASQPNFDARIYKDVGENSSFSLRNAGTGSTYIQQDGETKFTTTGGEEGYTQIAGGGTASADGAKIALYGRDYPTSSANDILYNAERHIFRNSTGGESPSYIQMNMTDAGLAELVVSSEDSSGEANVKIESYTPSLILSDKSSTNNKDFQIMANGNSLSISSGDTSGDAQLTNRLLHIDNTGKIRVGGENPQGEQPICYIHGTRDAATAVDRLELSGDEVALMSGSNYATEALKAAGGNVFVQNGRLLVGTSDMTPSDNTGTDTGVALMNWGSIEASRYDGPAGHFNRTGSDGAIITLRKNGAGVGTIGTLSGNLFIGSTNGSDAYLGFSNTFVMPVTSTGANRDNAISFGNAAARFDDIYATNGAIQTSDRNEKQDIEELSEAEQRVAVACKGLLRKFRWKSSVEENGEEARIHFGIIAQDLQAAFEAEGLDAGRYAMFINTSWWAHDVAVAAVEADDTVEPAIEAADAYTRTDTYVTEDEAPSGSTKKTRMGVRYSELLAFIISAI